VCVWRQEVRTLWCVGGRISFHFTMPSICRSQQNIHTSIFCFKAKYVQVYSIVKLWTSSSCNKACNVYIQSTVLTWFCISSNIIYSPIISILCVSVNISVCSSILLAVFIRVTSPTRLICILLNFRKYFGCLSWFVKSLSDVCVFVSGHFCGLIFQRIWMKLGTKQDDDAYTNNWWGFSGSLILKSYGPWHSVFLTSFLHNYVLYAHF
jgi:hypothetical protein